MSVCSMLKTVPGHQIYQPIDSQRTIHRNPFTETNANPTSTMSIFKYLTLLSFSLLLTNQSSAQLPNFEMLDCEEVFASHDVIGSILLFDPDANTWFSSSLSDWKVPSIPASTFKIANSLVALETKTVPDVHEVFLYHGQHDTSRYGIRMDVRHDMDLAEAFQRSSVWYFLELAEKIGCEKYQSYLDKIPYGNGKACGDELDFWNYGDFEVTPFEQILLLYKLKNDQLPFAKAHQEVVKEIMVNEEFQPYVLRAKTGWGRDETHDIGWWVGYVESRGKTVFFATRVKRTTGQDLNGFARSRKDITLRVLSDLGVIQ